MGTMEFSGEQVMLLSLAAKAGGPEARDGLVCREVSEENVERSIIDSPYDAVGQLPGVYPREVETYVHTKTCT